MYETIIGNRHAEQTSENESYRFMFTMYSETHNRRAEFEINALNTSEAFEIAKAEIIRLEEELGELTSAGLMRRHMHRGDYYQDTILEYRWGKMITY